MKIKKILNNNAILVGKNGKDFVWIGAGLGFQKKPGDKADETKIEKVFVFHQKKISEKFLSIIDAIPIEYVSLADDIILMAQNELPHELSHSIYISLTDHLYNLMKMYEQGIVLHNKLAWEIKKYYPVEFKVGKHALDLIEQQSGMRFPEEEAGNIAMHLINAQLTDEVDQPPKAGELAKKIRDILAIVRLTNRIEINEDSLAFDRFITHLRFFFQRIEHPTKKNKENVMLSFVKEQYPEAYETMILIEEYLKTGLSDDEKLYLSLHIQKLIENE